MENFDTKCLVPPYVKDLKPYVPGRTIEDIRSAYGINKIVKLASNENPQGPSPKALESIQTRLKALHRYPDIGAIELRKKLSEIFSIKIENICVGNGSEGIMANILRTFLCDNDEIITSEATFIGFQVLARGSGKKFIQVPMQSGYRFDIMEMLKYVNENTKIIYLCNPNNPTGTIFTVEEFDKFMENVPKRVLVILDEAYFEYSQQSEIYPNSLDYRYDNVITLRTFSKAYGLAGLRIGYGFAHEELITSIMKVKLPFEPGNLAQAAALAALDDIEFLKKTFDYNELGYKYLSEEFTKLGLKWIPSYSNFIMIDLDTKEKTDELNEKLLRKGVIVRPLTAFGLPHCIRVTIGLPEENEFLIKALKEVL